MNQEFTAYILATGQVLYSGTAYDPGALATDSLGIMLGAVYKGGWLAENVHHHQPKQPGLYHQFDWELKQWVDPRTSQNIENSQWTSVRQQRYKLLSSSDWVVTKASEAGLLVPPEWSIYRQALRDITLQADPWIIVWPKSP